MVGEMRVVVGAWRRRVGMGVEPVGVFDVC